MCLYTYIVIIKYVYIYICRLSLYIYIQTVCRFYMYIYTVYKHIQCIYIYTYTVYIYLYLYTVYIYICYIYIYISYIYIHSMYVVVGHLQPLIQMWTRCLHNSAMSAWGIWISEPLGDWWFLCVSSGYPLVLSWLANVSYIPVIMSISSWYIYVWHHMTPSGYLT